jgi:hypothetical protein
VADRTTGVRHARAIPRCRRHSAASLDQDTGVVVESIRIWIACRGDRLRRTQTQRPLARDGRLSRKTERTLNG